MSNYCSASFIFNIPNLVPLIAEATIHRRDQIEIVAFSNLGNIHTRPHALAVSRTRSQSSSNKDIESSAFHANYTLVSQCSRPLSTPFWNFGAQWAASALSMGWEAGS